MNTKKEKDVRWVDMYIEVLQLGEKRSDVVLQRGTLHRYTDMQQS